MEHKNIYMVLHKTQSSGTYNNVLKIPYLWEKPIGTHPPINLERWKDQYRIAMIANVNIEIYEILGAREPDYLEPDLLEAENVETADQKKKRESQNEKAISKALKDHEEAKRK